RVDSFGIITKKILRSELSGWTDVSGSIVTPPNDEWVVDIDGVKPDLVPSSPPPVTSSHQVGVDMCSMTAAALYEQVDVVLDLGVEAVELQSGEITNIPVYLKPSDFHNFKHDEMSYIPVGRYGDKEWVPLQARFSVKEPDQMLIPDLKTGVEWEIKVLSPQAGFQGMSDFVSSAPSFFIKLVDAEGCPSRGNPMYKDFHYDMDKLSSFTITEMVILNKGVDNLLKAIMDLASSIDKRIN
ncbi:MAG: hypothetical protein JAY72_20555, partial [Candidatus Thiodiazotropha endolucinida]|nr:hypothetical protein [Candidatus Thiodiazotropha taylori]MCW4324074.1 hypothetical protein [Candidatus Thiodiazotropha taylori]